MMNLSKEAEVLGKYIIKYSISENEIMRYKDGVRKLKYDTDNKIVNIAIKNPFLIPYIDASQSLMDKKHLLQKKLLLMFAILETTPKYASYFMAKPQSLLYIFVIIFAGIRAVFKSIIGIIIYKFLPKK